MPAFVGVLLQGFFLVITSVVGQWLFGLGIGIVAYTGMTTATVSAYNYVVTQASGLPASLLTIIHMMGMFTALNIILSAVAGKFAMSAAGSTTMKKFLIR